MSDLFWCTHCDNVISHYSESLYCSEECLRADAIRNHPLLGYTYPEFIDFPRPKGPDLSKSNSARSSMSFSLPTDASPSLLRLGSSTPTTALCLAQSSLPVHTFLYTP